MASETKQLPEIKLKHVVNVDGKIIRVVSYIVEDMFPISHFDFCRTKKMIMNVSNVFESKNEFRGWDGFSEELFNKWKPFAPRFKGMTFALGLKMLKIGLEKGWFQPDTKITIELSNGRDRDHQNLQGNDKKLVEINQLPLAKLAGRFGFICEDKDYLQRYEQAIDFVKVHPEVFKYRDEDFEDLISEEYKISDLGGIYMISTVTQVMDKLSAYFTFKINDQDIVFGDLQEGKKKDKVYVEPESVTIREFKQALEVLSPNGNRSLFYVGQNGNLTDIFGNEYRFILNSVNPIGPVNPSFNPSLNPKSSNYVRGENVPAPHGLSLGGFMLVNEGVIQMGPNGQVIFHLDAQGHLIDNSGNVYTMVLEPIKTKTQPQPK